MQVLEFEAERGSYYFQLEGLDSVLHAHPAAELVTAPAGGLTISTAQQTYKGLTQVLVPPHLPHAVYSSGGTCSIRMVEWPLVLPFANIAAPLGEIWLPHKGIATNDWLQAQHEQACSTPDTELAACIAALRRQLDQPQLDLTALARQLHRSPSRLSHWFKERMGISLRQYRVWLRLKTAMSYYLAQPEQGLAEAAYTAGFHDAAHLTRSFKRFLGIKPSWGYNSHLVQVSD